MFECPTKTFFFLFATASLQQQNGLPDIPAHIPLHTPHQPIDYSQQYQYNQSNHAQMQLHRPQPLYSLIRNGSAFNPYIRLADPEYANHYGNLTNYGKQYMYQSWMHHMYPNPQYMPNHNYNTTQYHINPLDNQPRFASNQHFPSPHNFDQLERQPPRNTPTMGHNAHSPVDVKPSPNISPLFHANRYAEEVKFSNGVCDIPKKIKTKDRLTTDEQFYAVFEGASE